MNFDEVKWNQKNEIYFSTYFDLETQMIAHGKCNDANPTWQTAILATRWSDWC